MRVGLLGGSFNPAHDGHLQVARAFRVRLRLDQVWLLVSPGNPLKPHAGGSALADRLASAARIANGRRIVATDIEARLGTRYTIDTLRRLRRAYPRVRFVWLMGADNLVQFPQWRRWREIARLVPIAVYTRPGHDRAARAGLAAQFLRHARLPVAAAATLADRRPPAWLFLPLAGHPASSSALRAAGLGVETAAARRPAAGKRGADPKDLSHRP